MSVWCPRREWPGRPWWRWCWRKRLWKNSAATRWARCAATSRGTAGSSRNSRQAENAEMIYPIVKYPDGVLEKPTARVTAFDEDFRKLTEEMFQSMYAAQGVGLA